MYEIYGTADCEDQVQYSLINNSNTGEISTDMKIWF